jgi:hypothetical protein
MPNRVRPATSDFALGTNASYSNWGTALAGHIVATVSGMSFDEYVERKIFAPLGMTRSTFREPLPKELADRMSGGYAFKNGAFERKGFEFIHNVGPAGSLSSTAADMAKFMLAHLQEGALGEARILKPETARLMHARALSPDPAVSGMCLGFYETWMNGRRVIGHGGDSVYFHSVLSLVPEAKLGLFVSFNTSDAGAAAYETERMFVQHFFPAHVPEIKPPADHEKRNVRYAGAYRALRRSYSKIDKALSAAGDFHVQPMPDGTLLMEDPLLGPTRWVEIGDGLLRKVDDDTVLAFKGDRGGKAEYLVGRFPFIAFERVAWYDNVILHGVLLGLGIVLSISAIVSAIRKRRADREGSGSLRWARPVLALGGLLLIAFLVGTIVALTVGIDDLIFGFPSGLRVALAFAILAVIPVLASLVFAVVAWRRHAWSLFGRLHYTLASLAALGFLWVINYWNLLGYRFG